MQEKKSLFNKIESQPFWIWLLPILGSYIAISMDFGVMNYYDIPFEYAEINIRTVSKAIIWFIVYPSMVAMVLSTLHEKRNEDKFILKILQNIHLSVIPIVILLLLYLLDKNLWLTLIYPACALVRITLLPAIDKKSNLPYKQRVYAILAADSLKTTSEDEQKSINAGRKFVFISMAILVLTAFTGKLGYHIEKGSAIFIVKNRVSTIAVKRNNNLYILKKYNPVTFVLSPEFEVINLDSGPLLLEERSLEKALISSVDEKKQQDKRLNDLKFEKQVSELISSLKSLFN